MFQSLVKRFDPQVVVTVFNELYTYRIELGLHVHRKVLESSTPFVTTFCDGDDLVLEDLEGAPEVVPTI